MTQSQRSSGFFKVVDLGEMIGVLEDLITYFAQPEDGLSHEDNQKFLKALKNRQDLFQEEGILNLVLDAIDKMNVITGQGILSALAGLATNSLYLVSFFVKNSLICLEGKSILMPFLFHFSQQLPRVRLKPLKGWLS